MNITKTKCHMLNLLILLTDKGYVADTFLSRSKVVELTSIPAGYLPEITKRLSNKGLVRTKRGKNGGTTLAFDPDNFYLSDLFDHLELLTYPENCSSTPNYFSECVLEKWAKVFKQTINPEQSLSEFTQSLRKKRNLTSMSDENCS